MVLVRVLVWRSLATAAASRCRRRRRRRRSTGRPRSHRCAEEETMARQGEAGSWQMADGMNGRGRGSAMAPRSRNIPETILHAAATQPGPFDSPSNVASPPPCALDASLHQAMPGLAMPSNGVFLAVPRSDLALSALTDQGACWWRSCTTLAGKKDRVRLVACCTRALPMLSASSLVFPVRAPGLARSARGCLAAGRGSSRVVH